MKVIYVDVSFSQWGRDRKPFVSISASINYGLVGCVVLDCRQTTPMAWYAMSLDQSFLYTDDQSLPPSNTSAHRGEIWCSGNTPDHTLGFYLLFLSLSPCVLLSLSFYLIFSLTHNWIFFFFFPAGNCGYIGFDGLCGK